jgi:hypothetical protein
MILVYSYAFPLKIFPFSLDDFLSALGGSEDESTADIIPEVFGGLLGLVCREFLIRFDANGNNQAMCDMPAKEDNGYYHSDPQISDKIKAVFGQYTKFDINERAGVDQWYKWVRF